MRNKAIAKAVALFLYGGIFFTNVVKKFLQMPSTVIHRISYDHLSSSLKIVFVSGSVYVYMNVPEEVFHQMKTAFSKGTFFNEHIKDKYKFEKVE